MTTGRPVVLVGPTASGKSALALALAARRPQVEIVSVDSMCVYRGMDIGTAKATPAQRRLTPHHLLDVVEPSEEFTVRRFQDSARAVLADIDRRGGRALLVGGTGLYVRAVVDDLELPGRYPTVAAALASEASEPGGLARLHARLTELDPVAAARMTASNGRRVIRALEVTTGSGRRFSSFGPGLGTYPPSSFVLVGLPFDASVDDARIERRLRDQLDAGLLDEVRALRGVAGGLSRTARQALGYRELLSHLEDDVALEDAVTEAVRRTKSFARRQWAWFRRDPRILWLDRSGDLLDQLLTVWDRSPVDEAGLGPPCPSPAASAQVGD